MSQVDLLINQASDYHRRGEFRSAESLYRQALALDPNSASANYMLGCMYMHAGAISNAVEPLAAACVLDPLGADAPIVLGNALFSLRRWHEAVDAYESALKIEPNFAPAMINLGAALQKLSRGWEAEAQYRKALNAAPDSAEANTGLAFTLASLERFDEAEPFASRAVQLAPHDANCCNNLGVALSGLDRPAEAEPWYQRAIDLDPTLVVAYQGMVGARIARGALDSADEPARLAVERAPSEAWSHDTLGLALLLIGKPEDAEASFRRALNLAPHGAGLYSHLASALRAQGRFCDSILERRRSVAIDPTPDLVSRLGMELISLGEQAEGWPLFEQRAIFASLGERFTQPKWDGSPLNGRTLLVYAEQGLGDTIQFARFLAPAAERAQGEIVFECQRPLLQLFGNLPGVSRVVARAADYSAPTVPFDCQISLLSLPAVFGTTEDTIPPARLPVQVSSEASATWREKLAALSGLKVGLRWAGNPRFAEDRFRSLTLDRFTPLATIKGVSFVSLQVGPSADEIGSTDRAFEILSWPEGLTRWTHTAALLSQLDLVISTCTSVPHLAGALGVETWLLLPFAPDWRWNINRPFDTPWYPHTRLFRQPGRGDWDSVIDRVKAELAERGSPTHAITESSER